MAEEHGRILVVDDNRMNRLKLSLSLEQQGHEVGLAEGGQQALDMLGSESFDVVLLDIMMPGMDGFQVLEHIKSDPKMRDIPVIVISALDEIESAVRCIEMGAEDYLPKSFNPVLLRARLSSSLQKKKLRDLEKAYLQQESMLRQSEKLATLGKLSAGMAHELNNPAAAAKRGAAQLREMFSRLQETYRKLFALNLTKPQLEALQALDESAQARVSQPPTLNPLVRSDLENDLEAWLRHQGVENAWEIAPALVSLGYNITELTAISTSFTPSQFSTAIDWLNYTSVIYSLLSSIGVGIGRISEVINALKAYTYMDQAPIQAVDINSALNNTLVILTGKLTIGIKVHREYATDLPRIEAYGSELNEAWTNLIDNAIDAVNGSGDITLRTRRDGQWVIVEVEDNGPGIPESIQSKVFDPFFTTKPLGQGQGLGLYTSHTVVVQKHKGKINVRSQPGKTVFEVVLPLDMEAPRSI